MVMKHSPAEFKADAVGRCIGLVRGRRSRRSLTTSGSTGRRCAVGSVPMISVGA